MAEVVTFPAETRSCRVVLDLDRTLFDTSRFMDDAAEAMEDAFHINADQFRQNVPQYYVQTSANLRTYDLFAHTADLALDPDVVESHLLAALSERTTIPAGYVYPDAPDFINFLETAPGVADVSILTYGKTRTQNIKLALSQTVLGAVPSVITESAKDSHLRAHFETGQGVIIDDKHIENLPPNFTHVFIDRESSVGNVYHSLADIQSAWPAIMGRLALAS